jgi:diaminohydroxyphosphoribosylaminopyrimidine deaminase/5-amino-6-(5-phosphoribosylamino)uracil reductase
MNDYEKYMQRALDLASLGLGTVSPNALVGCVIVHNDRILGEGWHRQYGGPHAEVHAINAVTDKALLPESTLFVNLEPCSHHGKTPPCTDLIITTEIGKVVIANPDPNPLVAGSGIAKLREAGVEVIAGVLAEAGTYLNRRFFTFHQQHRPYIILKWAETADGFMARSNYDSKWISNENSRQLVHQYRAQEDAIMVGRITAQYDNPELTVRQWTGKNPLRIVLDPHLSLSKDIKLFDRTVDTLCYNYLKNEKAEQLELVKAPEGDFIKFLLKDLYARNIQSVLVEGGGKLLNSLLKTGNWDEARVFCATKKFGEGIQAPSISAHVEVERIIAGDILKTYRHAST